MLAFSHLPNMRLGYYIYTIGENANVDVDNSNICIRIRKIWIMIFDIHICIMRLLFASVWLMRIINADIIYYPHLR
jgi:hypothetical protein